MGVLSRLASSGLLLLLLGCASAGEPRSDSRRDTLTRADLLETNEAYLYEAIQRLRPRWLRERSPDFEGRVIAARVFVDGSPWGELGVLRQMPVMDATEVRFLSAIDAATLYGTLAGLGGAILVRTGR